MKKAGRLAALFLLLTGVSGCGESTHLLMHDLLVFWNEVCDNMVRATNEETAADLLKVQFKLLGKKQENLQERVTKRFMDFKKAEAIELEEALLDYCDEIKATEKRLESCQKRLQNIIDVTPSHAELAKVRDWPNNRKVFDKVSLMDFTPRKDDANYPKPIIKTGLVPPRPQFTFAKPR
jgi:uncharacterized protein YabN with tetrapyrrole methylase and pyrophosphatase domain